MAGMAEVEIDRETGSIEVVDYVAVVDCGTPVNPNLARVQTEGVLHRELEWLYMKIFSITKKDRCETIPLCSTKFRADRT